MAVLDDLIKALTRLNGTATLPEIYTEYGRINANPIKSTVRRTLQQYSSDSETFANNGDFFFSVEGIGSGVWGLRNFFLPAEDENIETLALTAQGNENPKRKLSLGNRIIRDTALARQIKKLVGNKCQLCEKMFKLPNGKHYIEAHHIKPLGDPYKGPDLKENILVVCPNCHIKCDYGIISISANNIKNNLQKISDEFIKFHNNRYSISISD